MSSTTDFYGESVPEALKLACRELSTTQENLDVSVLETGSPGIFGLCRKKAHIRVSLKTAPTQADVPQEKLEEEKAKKIAAPAPASPKKNKKSIPSPAKPSRPAAKQTASPEQTKKNKPADLNADDLKPIRDDLLKVLDLMEYPSDVTISIEKNKVQCQISGEHEQVLVGPGGKTLDGLQYLIGKIASKRLATRVMLTLDAGNFREKRLEELKQQAIDFAVQVKENGKTKTIGSLNPSERRAVHMALQNDKEIRSRSVGGGLFKKVLIYVPGKGKKPGPPKRKGKRPQSQRQTSSKQKN